MDFARYLTKLQLWFSSNDILWKLRAVFTPNNYSRWRSRVKIIANLSSNNDLESSGECGAGLGSLLRKISSPVGGMSCTQPQMFPNICLVMRFNLIWPKSLIKQIVIEMILIYFKLQIKEWRNRDCRVSAIYWPTFSQLWWFNRSTFCHMPKSFQVYKKNPYSCGSSC